MASTLAREVPLQTFRGAGGNLRRNTVLALRWLLVDGRFRADERTLLLFADADLFVICAAASVGLLERFPLVSVVLLSGPESASKHMLKRRLIQSGMRRARLRVFLRTPELVESWRAAFPEFAEMFRLYPSVESVMPTESLATPSPKRRLSGDGATYSRPLRIGVVGQIRIGKCIPQLIRAASNRPREIRVAVYGPLFKEQPVEFIREMESHHLVHAGFLSEAEMLRIAGEQDYLSGFLERENWDTRMESATFWLGIKVGTPLLCFDEGWLGRMVRETGAGIALPVNSIEECRIEGIPGVNSIEYQRCLDSIRKLQLRLTPEALWNELERNLQ